VLSPKIVAEEKSSNELSVITRLVYGNTTFLFTGDAPSNVERQLVDSNGSLSADVLKAGHHGSRTSSNQVFLEAVKPRLAVISVGKNNYGHPHQEVLKRLRRIGISIMTTLGSGTITVTSDGQAVQW
jgi:competence protein ComEC